MKGGAGAGNCPLVEAYLNQCAEMNGPEAAIG
jgi:hypothetical protein